jgi:hypothetical protein
MGGRYEVEQVWGARLWLHHHVQTGEWAGRPTTNDQRPRVQGKYSFVTTESVYFGLNSRIHLFFCPFVINVEKSNSKFRKVLWSFLTPLLARSPTCSPSFLSPSFARALSLSLLPLSRSPPSRLGLHPCCLILRRFVIHRSSPPLVVHRTI